MCKLALYMTVSAALLGAPAIAEDQASTSEFGADLRDAAPAPGAARFAVAAGPITAEELAALLPPEEMTEVTQLRAYLREGVSVELRNAALRRIWMLVPAIRDYRDAALDYAQ